jgi:hypothetical protein
MDMDGTNAHVNRTDAYHQATDAACAERREIQAQIVSLEARVAGLHARDTSLETLVRTLRELLPSSQEPPASYTPQYTTSSGSLDVHRRVATESGLRLPFEIN